MVAQGGPRVYISCDMEGVAGIVDWQQVSPGGDYALGRELMLEEVNAAIDGALAAGASEVLVNDSHGAMQNLAPHRLHGGADYLSGRNKPDYMMEGLDPSFGAVFYIGYHGAIDGAPSVLSHTYNPTVVRGAWLGDIPVGEGGINALVAAHHRVPVALVSGDQHATSQSLELLGSPERVQVKTSVTRFAARSLHPERARRLIRVAAEASIRRLDSMRPPQLPSPPVLRVRLSEPDMVAEATMVRGVDAGGGLDIVIGGVDPLQTFRRFVAVLHITRRPGLER